MESLHGNKMGSLNILEQYEHVNCDFNVSIFEIIFLKYLCLFKLKGYKKILIRDFIYRIKNLQ
jgi:hypothetical protein